MEQRRSGHNVAVWALTILLAGLFLVTGAAKLVGASTFYLQAATMRGFPAWIRVVVGLVEVGSAVALLAPRAALYGAVALFILMFPAAVTQHMSGERGTWIPVVVALLLLYVAWRRNEDGVRALWRFFTVRPHAVLHEGIVAGVLGATCVAVWFLVVDILAGHALFTPETLGSALFRVLGPLPVGESPALHLVVYTVFHYAAFIAVGIIAAQLARAAGDEPSLLLGFVILFVAFEIGFYAFVALLQQATALGALAWPQVLAGNVLAAGAMGWYMWRTHPALGEQFAHALDGRP